jgi:hypothetical protein
MGEACLMHGIDEKCISNFDEMTGREGTTRKTEV